MRQAVRLLEWVPTVLIVIPIALPIVQAAGIDLIWFCTLVAVALLLMFPKLPTWLPSVN